jgi:hypothetical protein
MKVAVSALSITAVVAILGGGGGVSAAPKSSTPAKAVGPHIPKGGGLVQLTGYSDNDGPKFSVTLTGVVGDYGTAVRTHVSGSSGGEYNLLQVSVTRGSFGLGIAGLESKLIRAIYGNFPTNTSTCSGLVSVSAPVPVVANSGTGAYKGLRGTFHVNITINEVESWPSCPTTDTSPFLAQSVVISGTGTVSLR